VDYFARLTDRLRAVPGVQAVGFTSRLPFDFGNAAGFDIVGRPPSAPGATPKASYRQVSTDYFRTLGISILRGRVFGAGDDAHAPSVCVVNRTFVATYFGDQDPVGQSIAAFRDTLRIIGVVEDVPIGNLGDRIPPTLYSAFAKYPQNAAAVAIRTNAPLDQATRELQQAASAIDPGVAVTRPKTMETIVIESPSVFVRRFLLFLVGAFAATALVLAVVGVHGVVSYSVAQRTREMGIRMALGAEPQSLAALVVGHGGRMAAIGIAAGVAGALLLSGFAEKLLFGVQPTDPPTYVAVAVVLGVVSLLATVLPARRAIRVDPALALRAE
jgi:predicted permease